jgi:hypothetical protein
MSKDNNTNYSMFADSSKNILSPSKIKQMKEYLELKSVQNYSKESAIFPSMLSSRNKVSDLQNSYNKLNPHLQKLVNQKGDELSKIILKSHSPKPLYKESDEQVYSSKIKNFILQIPNFKIAVKNTEGTDTEKSVDGSAGQNSFRREAEIERTVSQKSRF